MTAPGHEPDEILTSKPEESEVPSDEGTPQDEIGDAHLPEDMRQKVREETTEASDPEAD